jgi:regulator of replication initiation timing
MISQEENMTMMGRRRLVEMAAEAIGPDEVRALQKENNHLRLENESLRSELESFKRLSAEQERERRQANTLAAAMKERLKLKEEELARAEAALKTVPGGSDAIIEYLQSKAARGEG